MNSVWKWCAILFLATSVVAQTSTPPKAKKKTRPATITAADVQALKDAIASQQAALAQQQQQIQELRDELHRKDQAVTQAQTAATDAASKADAAQATASQQQADRGGTEERRDRPEDQCQQHGIVAAGDSKECKGRDREPVGAALQGDHDHAGRIPGGRNCAAVEGAWASDINTPFNSLTMPGASQSAISEFFGSGRQSRISMLAEGRLKTAKLSGYVETDFLSSGTTSNNNESNSYSLRQRQAWGQAALDSGWSVTGGQMWSLVTETKHGMDNRTEATPHDDRPTVYRGLQLGAAVWTAPGQEFRQ